MNAYFEVINGHQEGERASIDKATIRIGNLPEADFAIDLGESESGLILVENGEGALAVIGAPGSESRLNGRPIAVGDLVEGGDLLEFRKVKVYVGFGSDKPAPAKAFKEARRR